MRDQPWIAHLGQRERAAEPADNGLGRQVTSELPAEAIYLYDVGEQRWLSPTYLPLRDRLRNTSRIQRGRQRDIPHEARQFSTELTTFVPLYEPAGIYLLTLRNGGETPRKIRFAAVFPHGSGRPAGERRCAQELKRTRPTTRFISQILATPSDPVRPLRRFPAARTDRNRKRNRFRARAFGGPSENGGAGDCLLQDASDEADIASFLTTLEIPAGASRTVSVVLGQADTREQAEAVIRRCGYGGSRAGEATGHLRLVARPDAHAPSGNHGSGIRPLS